MDRIISLFFQHKYTELEKMFEGDLELSNNDFVGLLTYFMTLLELGLLKDNKVFLIVFLILNRISLELDFSSINKYLLRIDDYPLTYKFIKNNIQLLIIHKNLEFILKELSTTDGTIKKYFNDKTDFQSMEMIVTGELRMILNSFHDTIFINSIKSSSTSTRMTKQWEITVGEEIKIRLCCLINLFGKKLLNFLDVPLMRIGEYLEFDTKQKMEYYITCISKINFGFKTIERIMRSRQKTQYKINQGSKIYVQIKDGIMWDDPPSDIREIVDIYFD
jgi:hypothetical protein